MNTNIKNIIFDFGGVLLDIDYQLTYAELSTLLGKSFDPANISTSSMEVLYQYETGQITLQIFSLIYKIGHRRM